MQTPAVGQMKGGKFVMTVAKMMKRVKLIARDERGHALQFVQPRNNLVIKGEI